jgi:hypothetical protein
MALRAANVSVVVTFAGDVAGSTNVPGNFGLADKDKGREKRKVGELHGLMCVIFDKV